MPKNAPDPAVALTAVGAIFAALVGTSLLDMGNSEPAMRVADHVTQAIWIPLFLLFAYLTVRPESKTLRDAAWILAGIAGFVTAGVVVFTTFGFTRDRDYVLLRLDAYTRQVVTHVCGRLRHKGLVGNIETKSLSSEFVIFDFSHNAGRRCETLDIPRSAVVVFREIHTK